MGLKTEHRERRLEDKVAEAIFYAAPDDKLYGVSWTDSLIAARVAIAVVRKYDEEIKKAELETMVEQAEK